MALALGLEAQSWAKEAPKAPRTDAHLWNIPLILPVDHPYHLWMPSTTSQRIPWNGLACAMAFHGVCLGSQYAMPWHKRWHANAYAMPCHCMCHAMPLHEQ